MPQRIDGLGHFLQAYSCGWLILLVILIQAATTGSLCAHDSPEHVAAALTQQMAEQGKSAELLYRRGVEYRALRERKKAARDFKEAVRWDPTLTVAWAEWTSVLLETGSDDLALRTVNQGLLHTTEKAAVASLLRARAEVQFSRGDYQEALADCAQALEAHPGDLDGYLLRGRLQAALGKHEDAANGFQEGYQRTGSFVLKNEWIESLIDAGHCRPALQEIEPELAQSRWQSSWLLRRARARLCLQQTEEAHRDLQNAIREINGRLNPNRPDLTLLADRGLAHALLGEMDQAREDLRQAEEAGAESWVLERLTKSLRKK